MQTFVPMGYRSCKYQAQARLHSFGRLKPALHLVLNLSSCNPYETAPTFFEVRVENQRKTFHSSKGFKKKLGVNLSIERDKLP